MLYERLMNKFLYVAASSFVDLMLFLYRLDLIGFNVELAKD